MAPNNTLGIWGNEKTMNLNTLILTNIQSSPYFKVNLYEKKTYHEVIDEIFYKVSHLEPWEKGSRKTAGQTGMCGGVRGVGAGGIVSSAYCLLYKLFTLRLTRKQLVGLLDHADSPYIRGLGFMYIRYCQDPKDMWEWYEPYLDDDEEIDVKAGGGHVMTIGEMLRQWLVKLEWYATLFPRIPVPVQKDIDIKMRERNMQRFEVEQEEAQPRHIADDELNFGEAERYAVTAATRARSPTPPYRSRPRTPPPRPDRHRSPPRTRVSPSRHRPHHVSPTRQRQRSPQRPRSPHRQRSPRPREGEPAIRTRDGEPASRNRDGEPGYKTREGEPALRTRDGEPGFRTRDGEPALRTRDGEPMDFSRELQREKERQGRQPSEDRSRPDEDDDDDDDPINFAKKLLRKKEMQQQGTALTFREKLEQRAKSLEAQKLNETEKHHKQARSKDKNDSVTDSKEKSRKRSGSKDKNDSVTDSKEKSRKRSRSRDKDVSVTNSKEKSRKRSHSKEKEDKSSHEMSKHHRTHEKKSKKHHKERSGEKEKKKHKSKHRSRSKSVDRNGHQP